MYILDLTLISRPWADLKDVATSRLPALHATHPPLQNPKPKALRRQTLQVLCRFLFAHEPQDYHSTSLVVASIDGPRLVMLSTCGMVGNVNVNLYNCTCLL